ncbi:MAG TPA: CHAT domain-containing protein, partial [Ferruginibacter sp.]|nr:CHAT domain-containing protein [Ferruginibacter sp.]
AEALYARADCITAMGTESITELENAVSCYKLAFETERKLLDAFSYDESRQQMLEATRKQSEKAISLCYRLWQKTKNSKWANEAFLFAEHNKSFILTESVRRNTAASIYLQNDSLYEKLQLLKSQLSMIETELGKQHASGKPDTLLIRSLSETRKKNEVVLLEAENNLRIQNPAYSNWLAGNSSLPAEELTSKTTASGNAFIEYFAGDSCVYAFSAEKNKALAFYKLPQSIKSNTDSLLHYFSNRNAILNDPAGYAATATGLYKLALAPYVSTGSSALLIIPDGFISLIPFDALLTGPVTSSNISSFPFLIKQQQTGYAFSCRTLIEQSNSANTVAKNNIAVFAPVFANRERGLAPLSNSLGELDAVKQLYPEGKFFSAAMATMKQFENNCSNSAIIHLATHAGTGNNTAMAGIEFYDSTLYLNRIYTMPLKASLVVLSGCETGTGSLNKTEGLMSLARGFSYAGTKNVIGSLWPTDDRVSAEIFKNFYSDLRNNDFSTALHKAKLAVIDNASAASASPYFWSGYIYIGSPEANSKSSSFGWVKYTLIASSLLAIAAFFALRRKREN